MTDDPIEICPLNDLNIRVGPIKAIAATGTPTPITDGTAPLGFLSTSNAADAEAADAALSASLSHIGGQDDGHGGTYEDGTWLFQLNAAVLPKALLETHFLRATPYFILSRTDDVRVVKKCVYKEAREAD